MNNMKFGIGLIPQGNDDENIRLSKLAEDAGFEYLWISDNPNMDLYKLLRNILIETETIKIGPGVTNPFIRKPGKLSIEMMNLNKLSDNRITLGIGPGNKSQLDKMNITWEKPLTKLKRSINVINDMNHNNPKNKIPIYVEATGPKLVELAGKLTNGVMVNASHPKDYGMILKQVENSPEISKKGENQFDIMAYSATSIDNDYQKAQNAAKIVVAFIIAGSPAHVLERHGISEEIRNDIYLSLSKGNIGGGMRLVKDDFIEEFSIAGTCEDIIPKIKDLEKIGVTQYIASAPIGNNIAESIKLFGEVISTY
ncbi:5,10-methylenetetrahydromethanopterin reductase [Methanobrevibacter sp.]|uniref:5,10-methylenetetrahydromethanopterin reductase n=1 Tax=Methanobrevibacter sp. TaxID=66852 RepID=UPI0038902662